MISFAENSFMRVLVLSLFSIVLFSCNNSREEQKIVSRHTDAFNHSIQSIMDSYRLLTEAFVNWDSTAVISRALGLKTKLSGIKLDEFPAQVKDSANRSIDLAQQDLDAMTVNITLTQKRHRLNSLTQNIYTLLKTLQYDERKVYLNECPMAFNDSIPGDWLSETDSIRNPYMGLHHPHYGSAMIECGQNKSTIDFTTTRTENNQKESGDKSTGDDSKEKKK